MRSRHRGPSVGLVPVAAALAALALLVGGCAGDVAPLRPGAASCVVQGTVNGAGQDSGMSVYIEEIAPTGERAEFEVRPGGSDAYRVEVPAGDYFISVYGQFGRVYYCADGRFPSLQSEADTVRLDAAHSPFTADFAFGALSLAATLPAMLDGASAFLEIVRVEDGERRTSGSVTVSDGRVALTSTGLVPGSYRARFKWRYDYDHVGGGLWLPGSHDVAEATVYRVAPDTVIVLSAALGSSTCRLAGRIGGAWQAMGLDRPLLNAVDADSLAVFGPWRVDEDGSFDLVLLGPAAVKLGARCGAITRWIGGTDFDTATVFSLAEGDIVDGIELIGGGLRLQVVSGGLAGPYDQALLTFYDPGELVPRLYTYGTLGRQIGIANLPAGDWLVRVEPVPYSRNSWRPQWLDRAATAAEATVLTIPAGGGVLAVDLVLEAGGVIRGQLLQAPDPWYTYDFSVTTADDATTLLHPVVLSADKQFECTGPPDGQYKIGVAHFNIIVPPGGDPLPPGTIWYPGTTDWATAGVVTINDAGTVEGVEITFP